MDDLAAGKGNFINGFRVPDGFVVEQFASDNDTSSVLCMTFNGKGQLLTAAAGSGPTEIRILDALNGFCTGHRVFYPGLHCQGMCAIGADIYVIGNGKLYFLQDKNGHADSHEPLCPELLGPELTDVAKRFDPAKILEDIVYPSKVVDARYRQIVFKTKDGQRIAGFASAETEDSLSVTNGEAVTVILKKADIELKTATDKSIMPDGLLDTFTPEQIRDLLAFLESGK